MEFFLPCVYALAGSLAFGLRYQLSVKKPEFYAAFAGGMLCWGVYLACAQMGSEIGQAFAASLAVTLYGELMARVLRVPVTVFLLVGLIPLVPGGGIYYTMTYCIRGDMLLFLRTGMHTFGLAGAMAIGILLGSTVTRLGVSICSSRAARRMGRGKICDGCEIHPQQGAANDAAQGTDRPASGKIDLPDVPGARGNGKKGL